MKQMTGLDASFLYFERPRMPMHVGGLYIYDQSTAPGGQVRFKDILNFIEERVHLVRSFRQRSVPVPLNLDHPYWINDPEFNIEYHVRHMALPQPGDWRQLCILAARLFARPLDLTKPLWEFNVIEGLDNVPGVPKGSYALMTKVHHAAIDGVSGMEMTAAINSLHPDDPPPDGEKKWSPEAVPSAASLIARAYGNNLRQPMKFADVVVRSVPALAQTAAGLGRGDFKRPAGGARVPRTRFNGTLSAHRVFEGRVFELDVVRDIKSRFQGATINDAILSIVGGGMRKYLESKNELPDDTLIAMAPISVRTAGEKRDMGNQVSAMSVQLGTHVPDPLGRLEYAHESARNSKEFTNAIGARQLADYSKFIPAALTGLAARLYTGLGLANSINPMFNCVVTNVPGPQVPLYSTGARMVNQFGLGPIVDGMGLIHPILSYCGQITVSFTSDREMIPDPEFYADCIQESFDELQAAAIKKPQVKQPAKRKRAPAKKTTAAKRTTAKKTTTPRRRKPATSANGAAVSPGQAPSVQAAPRDDQ